MLQFYDESTSVIARTMSGASRGYLINLPAGHYQVRAGLSGAVGGFLKVYDVGALHIEEDRRWDIDLSSATTAVEDVAIARPDRYVLEQNFPNPFNPSTIIRYQLSEPTEVELRIFNIMGQEVRRLVEDHQSAGIYSVHWNGRDNRGRPLATGVYLYRLQAGAQTETRKLLLLR